MSVYDRAIPADRHLFRGMWNGAPITVGYYIWKSMIPALIGNTIGGALFVGAVYWYLYLTGEGSNHGKNLLLSSSVAG